MSYLPTIAKESVITMQFSNTNAMGSEFWKGKDDFSNPGERGWDGGDVE